MRLETITVRITDGEHKGTTHYTANVQVERNGETLSWTQSFDTPAQARAYARGRIGRIHDPIDTVTSLRTPAYAGEHDDCPVNIPHDHEQHCRCCDALMGGSDHCPDCGCEEYEETDACPARLYGSPLSQYRGKS